MAHTARVALAGLAVAFAMLGCDSDSDDDGAGRIPASAAGPASPPTPFEPEVDLGEAQDIALEVVGGGQVVEASIEDVDDPVRVWEVTVLSATGERRQITVDVTSGSVLGNELDD